MNTRLIEGYAWFGVKIPNANAMYNLFGYVENRPVVDLDGYYKSGMRILSNDPEKDGVVLITKNPEKPDLDGWDIVSYYPGNFKGRIRDWHISHVYTDKKNLSLFVGVEIES